MHTVKGIKLQPFTAQGKTIEIYYAPIPDQDGIRTRGMAYKEDGVYKVFISTSISIIQQHHTLGHELAHVFCGHLEEKDPDRTAQEREANQKAWDYYNAYVSGDL